VSRPVSLHDFSAAGKRREFISGESGLNIPMKFAK